MSNAMKPATEMTDLELRKAWLYLDANRTDKDYARWCEIDREWQARTAAADARGKDRSSCMRPLTTIIGRLLG